MVLERLTECFYVNDSEHKDDFTDLSMPAQRSLGDALQALRC